MTGFSKIGHSGAWPSPEFDARIGFELETRRKAAARPAGENLDSPKIVTDANRGEIADRVKEAAKTES